MNEIEAGEFVAALVHSFPNTRFTEQNASAYQKLVLDIDRNEAESARFEIANTSKFMPTIAEIREVVMRNRRQRRGVLVSKPLALPDGNVPTRSEWAACLTGLLESSARFQAMASRWCGARGLPVPSDPASVFVELARSGAEGQDVRRKLRGALLGDMDEQDRRHP